MKEPERIPLTSNPKNKEPQKIRLIPVRNYNDDLDNEDENYQQNNTTSIQQLESDKTY